MKIILTILILISVTQTSAQKPKDFFLVQRDTTGKKKFIFTFIDKKGKAIARLDSSKYDFCLSDTFYHFAVVGLKTRRGWWAIDKNETLLFEIYNTSPGEPAPDELQEGMIRIVNKDGKIGFANTRGQIVIEPQFEAVTRFSHGKAIFGRQCKQILWCCEGENEDKHYLTKCGVTGYINKKGQIQKVGRYTFEQIQTDIGWKSEIEN